MVSTNRLWNPGSYPNFSQMTGLGAMAMDPSGTMVPQYDWLLGFHFDNENFSSCLKTGSACDAPFTSPWNGSVDPQPGIAPLGPFQELYAFDRAQNGGQRGVPHYYLNGNPNVARAYSSDEGGIVNADGDHRMDITGSYRVSSFEHGQRAPNQPAPGVFVQLQGHLAKRFLPLAWGGIARGARGIATWRDEPSPLFLRGPLLRICGNSLPTLVERLTLENPVPGSIVQGAQSVAQAEILEDEGAWSGCGGPSGRTYMIKMQPNGVGAENFFTVGEALEDPVTGLPLGDATVAEVVPPYEVVHVGSLDQFDWTNDLPTFRDNVAFLHPVLETDHDTAWEANCLATLTNVPGNPTVPFGEGVVCGGRTLDDVAYLIVSNTHFEIDPFAPYLQQHVGETMDVDVTLSNLTFPVEQYRRFDFAANDFETAVTPVSGNQFTLQLDPLSATVLMLPEPSASLGIGSGGLVLLALHRRRRGARVERRDVARLERGER